MDILDAQIEAVDGEAILSEAMGSLEFAPSEAERQRLIVDAILLSMDAVGVDGGLWHGYRSIGEAAFARCPERFRAISMILDPDKQDLDEELGSASQNPGVAGIRLLPAWPPSGESLARFHAGAYEPWFAGAERLDLVVALYMPGHLREVRPIAERYPSLRILVDHVGMLPPPVAPPDAESFRDLPELLALAEHENVAVKFTGVPALSKEGYPFLDLWPACDRMIEAFGVNRLMWGSDFLRVAYLYSYAESLNFARYSPRLSDTEKESLLGGSLRNWIRWFPES